MFLLGKLAKQLFPDAPARPADEAVVDPRMRPINLGTFGPPAAGLQHVHNAADHTAVILAFDAAHILRQVRLDALPLVVTQPKELLIHSPHSHSLPQSATFPPSPGRGCASIACGASPGAAIRSSPSRVAWGKAAPPDGGAA